MWRILHAMFGYHYIVLDILGSQYVHRLIKTTHLEPCIEHRGVRYYLNRDGTMSTFVTKNDGYMWGPLTFKLEGFWKADEAPEDKKENKCYECAVGHKDIDVRALLNSVSWNIRELQRRADNARKYNDIIFDDWICGEIGTMAQNISHPQYLVSFYVHNNAQKCYEDANLKRMQEKSESVEDKTLKEYLKS